MLICGMPTVWGRSRLRARGVGFCFGFYGVEEVDGMDGQVNPLLIILFVISQIMITIIVIW